MIQEQYFLNIHSPHVQILTDLIFSVLSKLVFKVFYPCEINFLKKQL